MKHLIYIFISAASFFGASAAEVNNQQTLAGLMAAGNYSEARQALAASHASPNQMLLLEANIASAQGNLSLAIKIYRELTVKYPRDGALRIQLIKTLIANQNYESAQYHLRELAARTNDPQLKAAFINEANKISQYDKFGVSGSFGLTPSTNVNNANEDVTQSFNFFGNTVEYEQPPELQPQFGWRASVGVSAFAKSRIADNQDLVLRGNIRATKYTVPTLDQYSAEVSLNWNYRTARDTLSISPFLQRRLGDGEAYDIVDVKTNPHAEIIDRDEDSWSHGVRIYTERRLRDSKSVFLSASYSKATYDDQDDLGSYADNDYTNLRLGYSFLANPRNRVSFWVGGSKFVQEGNFGNYEHWSNYDGKNIGVSVETVYASGVRSKFSFEYFNKNYLGEPPAQAMGYDREDNINSLSLELSNQKWTVGKFLPQLDCQYSIADSNYDSYSVNGGSCGVSFTQNF